MHWTDPNGGSIFEVLDGFGTSGFVNFECDVEIPNLCLFITLNVSKVKLRDLLQPGARVCTDQRNPVMKRFFILRVRDIRAFKQLRQVVVTELLEARAATLRLLTFGVVLIDVSLPYGPLKKTPAIATTSF